MAFTREDLEMLGLNDDPDLIFDQEEKQASVELIQAREASVQERQAAIVRGRKTAFARVFRDGNASLDDVAIVMEVLKKFCRWRDTTFHPDARLHAVAEGRREVLLLVDDYCELPVDELLAKLA